jgi:hypothetical protein
MGSKVFGKRHDALRDKRDAERKAIEDGTAKERVSAPIQFADVKMIAAEGNPYHKAGDEFECSEAVAVSVEGKGWATRANGASPKVKAKELKTEDEKEGKKKDK